MPKENSKNSETLHTTPLTPYRGFNNDFNFSFVENPYHQNIHRLTYTEIDKIA